MAYREVTLLEVKEVLRLWLRRRPKKAIARQVGVARNTVRKFIEAGEACGLSQAAGEAALTEEKVTEVLLRLKLRPVRRRGDSWALCQEQSEFIKRHVKAGVRLTKIRKLLRRQQVEIPYPTLHRFAVEELGFGRARTTIPVADCGPGEEVQVDPGRMGFLYTDLFGRKKLLRAWIFTAVRSRHRFVYPCFRETTDDAIAACEAAWEFFGGVFKVLIPDNTKAIVQRYDRLYPVINETFLEYAQSRGFEIDPTRRRSPQDKGRVERAVATTRDDCFGGERLQNVEAARRHATHWCLREYGMRRHTRTQRMPLEYFEAEEKAALLPAPTEPYDVPLRCEPTVHRDQHCQVAKALYSVPRDFEGIRLVGKVLRARADSQTVRLYVGKLLVKTHPRKPPGGRSTHAADFPPEQWAYANRDTDFLKHQAHKHGDAVGIFAEALLSGPQPWTKMRRVYALLGLCRRYGDGRVCEACVVANEVEMFDVRRLERMIKLGHPQPPPDQPGHLNVIPLARYLRPAHQYALPFRGDEPQQEEPND